MKNTMNKKVILTIFAFFLSISASAQVDLDDYMKSVGDATQVNRGPSVLVVKAVEVEGSPFLFDDFVFGILVNKKVQTKPLRMNYDLSNNRLIVEQDGRMIAVNPNTVTEIRVQEKGLVLKSGFETPGEDHLNSNSLFEVIFEGDRYTILKHSGVSKQENVASYGTATQTDVFVPYTDYYVISDSGFEGLSSRKRKFYRIFGDDRKTVENFVSEQNLDRKSDADLARIFEYADSL